jgi:hypothetical protein
MDKIINLQRNDSMGLLYKPKAEQTVTFEVKTFSNDTLISIDFYSDCGKFGTEEGLASFVITSERLLQILQEREDITDKELG